jgi:hypothetical protein
MIVAIHQPNYLPWLGYFAKIARADVFVFLDDVQFSKGSFTNRVKIASGESEAWLSIPVTVRLGMEIRNVQHAKVDVGRAHADRLKATYRSAPHFHAVFPWLADALAAGEGALSASNAALVCQIAERLGLKTRFVTSSALGIVADDASERLAMIVHALSPGGTYLAGGGAQKYQDDAPFLSRGLSIRPLGFSSPHYPRDRDPFIPGLSIVDALFHIGVDGVKDLLSPYSGSA